MVPGRPESEAALLGDRQQVRNIGAQLVPERGVDVDKATLDGIRKGLKSLVQRKLLRPEHASLVSEHLDTYTLRWLDS